MMLVGARPLEDTRRPIIHLILVMGPILLMMLPFVTTFNEFLTSLVQTSGLDAFLTDRIAPVEARLAALLLALIGTPSQVSKSPICLSKGGFFLPVYISWNCEGWQSFITRCDTWRTAKQSTTSRAPPASMDERSVPRPGRQ